jgi:CelD/BcsL family acetyltransferase involved in cellulose biosynthesis
MESEHALFSFPCHDGWGGKLGGERLMPQDNLTVARVLERAGNGSVVPDGSRPAGRAHPNHTEQRLPSSSSPPLAVTDACLREPARSDAIKLELHADLGALEEEWKAFERHADCTVFQTFDWLAAWQRHIGMRNATAPAIVLGRDDRGEILFIFQLAIETRNLGRCLTWLGSDLCDYNAPLLAPASADHCDSVALWQDIIALLRAESRFRFDWIDLQKMPETIGAQRNPFLNLQVLAHPSGAYVTNLGDDWNEFYPAKRSSSTRKKERRQVKQLGEYGKVQFHAVENRMDVERTLDTLLDQKARSFARMGVENIFARPGYRAFFRDIVSNPAMHEMTHVSRLDIGETIAAANVGLRFRDCYYLIISSYHDGEFSRFGPGRAHLNELLRHAIRCGFRRFDFTVGDEPYKRDWCDTELRMYDYLAPVTVRGRLAVAIAQAFRRTKRFIKQTPALWQAFSKARVLAGWISHR